MIGLLGTMMKESGSLYPVREAWWVYDKNPAAAYAYYADTSKHAAYGGGPAWHGRGIIQATHKNTYEAFNNAMIAKFGRDTDVMNDPDLMLQAEVSAHFAAYFFESRGLVPLCEARSWPEIRRRVWGAYGDSDGVGKLQRAEAVLLPLAQARGVA